MTGVRAAMERAFSQEERNVLDETRMNTMGELAERTRELIESVVLTDVDDAELAAISAEVAALNERLAVARRPKPPVATMDPSGLIRHPASPVTGNVNPIAPPIEMIAQPDGTVRTEFTLSSVYEGPPGLVHGGISALILDHLLGAAAAANGTPGMTATLSMAYRRPTPYGVPLVAEARAVRSEGRKTFVDGRITGPDGRPTVEASAMFILPLR